MAYIEITEFAEEQSRLQRWSHFLTIIVAALAFAFGLNLRSSALNAVRVYSNVQAGIEVSYPRNWLIDESGDYVFRIQDMTRVGFKPTILIQTVPIGEATTLRTVLDSLNINRPRTFIDYNVLSLEDTTLPDDTPGEVLTYTYVATEENAFLESLPIVVLGQDIVTRRGSQAIIITFLAEAGTFADDLATFNRFLDSLDFT